jgi:hypothetical protein
MTLLLQTVRQIWPQNSLDGAAAGTLSRARLPRWHAAQAEDESDKTAAMSTDCNLALTTSQRLGCPCMTAVACDPEGHKR